jgi:DNA-binding XRE family transcriptional regulator
MSINRIKVVLAEKNLRNKWLAQKLDKNPTTISKWCTNESQPSLETLKQIAHVLEVDIRDLLIPTKNKF